MVALLVKEPRGASSEMAMRMLDTEASLGEKLMLIECIPAAAAELADQESTAASNSVLDKVKSQIQADNKFFGISSIFDDPVRSVGTVKRVSKSLQSSLNQSIPARKNNFLPVCELFVSQLFFLMSEQSVLDQPFLAGRILMALSTLLGLSTNHWNIKSITQDAFKIFIRLKDLVESYKMWQIASSYKSETLSQVQTQFKIGLALCIGKNTKWLNETQIQVINDWLGDQIELYGEQNINFETAETVNIKEVCMMVG